MSDQFQHVMVLTSIIIGLGITNVLLGVSGAIERYTEGDRPLQLSWASAFWLAQVFL
jgi:multisubunit Na+/H+ antiporter MnhC subunit